MTNDGVDALRERLFDAAHTIRARATAERFRLAVDRSFTLAGAGTVVTGTVLSGAVATGDHVTISPSGLVARVRSLHAQNRPTERGVAGQRCALNLAGDGISKDAIARGQVVLDPDLHAPTDRIDATLRLLATEQKPVRNGCRRGCIMPRPKSAPASCCSATRRSRPAAKRVQLVLERPIAAAAGDRFVLRDTTAQRTIGGGKFLDLRAPPRKRRTPERLAQLRGAYDRQIPSARSRRLLERRRIMSISPLSRATARSAKRRSQAICDGLSVVKATAGERVFALSAPVWLQFKRAC